MKRRYRFVRHPSRQTMGRIIMKWGGGLITDKTTICTPYLDRIHNLSICVKKLYDLGHEIIIVHGAGSFGHIVAREYRLSDGNIPELEQNEAINQVRTDMDSLNQLVIDSLLDLDPVIHAPRNFVVNTGPHFEGDISRFLEPGIHITFGDVVDCNSPMDFGILSGDDIMFRLGTELPDVTHVIFALGDTPGLMSTHGADGILIPEWDASMDFDGHHTTEIDVTGGIFLKVERASAISKKVEHVWFVDGTNPERINEIVDNGKSIGTKINPI